MGGGKKTKPPKKPSKDIPCRYGRNCHFGEQCRFKHHPSDFVLRAEVKIEHAETKEPEAPVKGPPLPTVCLHCKNDPFVPKSILKSAVKNEDQKDSAMDSLENRFKGTTLNSPDQKATEREITNHGFSQPKSDLSSTNYTTRNLFPANPPSTPQAQTPRRAVTPQSFSTPRPKSKPKDKIGYDRCIARAKYMQNHHEPGAFVIANWGICTAAHGIIVNPSLRQLSYHSFNTDDMGPGPFRCRHVVDTDKGGSVVRCEFYDQPADYLYVRQLHAEIVEFASKLHVRLVAEFLYKAAPDKAEKDDEIIVYYACRDGPVGLFRYVHP